jgi:tripeptidyl-peptidase I
MSSSTVLRRAIVRMVSITWIFLGSLIAFTSATPTSRSGMFVRSSRSDVPAGFAHQGVAPADKSIPLRVALIQSNIGGLEKALDDVSNPSSPNYGNHLSKEEVYVFLHLCLRVF